MQSCIRALLSIVMTLGAVFMHYWYPVASDSVPVTRAPLPRNNWVGRYAGVPTFTPAGPMATPLNFSITEVEGTDGSMWLMEHFFEHTYLAQGSHQQFWVNSFLDPVTNKATSNLTYCGQLRGFNAMAGDLAFVQVNMTEVKRNDTHMEWHLNPQPVAQPQIFHQGNWTGKWTLTLVDGGSKIISHFMMPRGEAQHAHIVFHRIDDSKPTIPKPTKMDETLCRVKFAGLIGGPNWDTKGATKARFGSCPLGFEARRDYLIGAGPAVSKLDDEFQYCYMANRFLNFTVAWNWKPGGSNDVEFVITTTATGTDDRYVAIGFFPQWPAMQGMDIALGYLTHDAATGAPTGCVQSLYAQEYVGTPVPNPTQALTNTSVWTADGLMHVAFTRPWASGHTNLTAPPNDGIPAMSYAVGTVASPEAGKGACGGVPQYHGGRRGTYGVLWNYPQGALPEHMKCV
mmetsp:Transcript_11430/g.35529  ORF Transcript_11430/g.35529 Transcript_11430/m.35529 type:complete len:456 (-) Transcript_11430:204-1571(-)